VTRVLPEDGVVWGETCGRNLINKEIYIFYCNCEFSWYIKVIITIFNLSLYVAVDKLKW